MPPPPQQQCNKQPMSDKCLYDVAGNLQCQVPNKNNVYPTGDEIILGISKCIQLKK